MNEPDGDHYDDTDASQPTLEIISGSADSTLTFWTDTTASTAAAATTLATARIEQDQELQNHIRASNFREAIVLALQLNHPKRLLDLFTAVVDAPQREEGSFTGRKDVDEVLRGLSDAHLFALLRRLRDWNANGRTSHVAQRVLYSILHLHPKERILGLDRRMRRRQQPALGARGEDGELADAMSALTMTEEKAQKKESMRDVVEGLRAYTERHQTRLERQGEERFVLVWALEQMDAVGGEVGQLNGVAGREGDVMILGGT